MNRLMKVAWFSFFMVVSVASHAENLVCDGSAIGSNSSIHAVLKSHSVKVNGKNIEVVSASINTMGIDVKTQNFINKDGQLAYYMFSAGEVLVNEGKMSMSQWTVIGGHIVELATLYCHPSGH